jgi:hypothetical protein
LRESRSGRGGVAQDAVLFDSEFEIGDPAAPVGLIADDEEGVALDAFDLESILAAAGATRPLLYDKPFTIVRYRWSRG